MLVRALGAEPLGAAAATLLFAIHMALFKVHWEPMYVFDLVCGTCTLVCLLSYVRGRVILSLAFFWLALKAKEVAIMLPLVLAGYEWWFGGKRWKRLIPFFCNFRLARRHGAAVQRASRKRLFAAIHACSHMEMRPFLRGPTGAAARSFWIRRLRDPGSTVLRSRPKGPLLGYSVSCACWD